jgi:hypothetical protein
VKSSTVRSRPVPSRPVPSLALLLSLPSFLLSFTTFHLSSLQASILGDAIVDAAFASFEDFAEPSVVLRSRMISACGRYETS